MIYILIILILIILFLLYSKFELFTDNNYDNKLCCIYAYYEKNELYRNNFLYFLNNAILDEIDYYLVINGDCTLPIPKRNNIHIIFRENLGYDFGAYSHVIQNYINKEYDYYIFLNTSVRGPYLKDSNIKWYEPFLKLFNNNVKIVGTTINIYNNDILFDNYNLKEIYKHPTPFTHIQSMFFVMDNEYFNYLKNINFFDENKINNINNIEILIIYYEIGLSQHALQNNWNINCILNNYKNLDYINIKEDIYINPTFVSGFYSMDITPYDVIFFKNNRL
jgi:hypothetical protein